MSTTTSNVHVVSMFKDINETMATNFADAVTPVSEGDTPRTEEVNDKTTTETRAQEKKKDDGGCMKIFSVILQVVAAVVAVAPIPGGAAIAAALTAASKAIAPKENAGGGSGTPVDADALKRAAQQETERLTPQYRQLGQSDVAVA